MVKEKIDDNRTGHSNPRKVDVWLERRIIMNKGGMGKGDSEMETAAGK